MMAGQEMREKTIPVLTVLKNGTILKNIFVVNSRDFASPERNGNDEDEVEQILIVGRHPDCDILLTHPSISKYHLQIRSLPSRQKLFVTDLSSVHGTWVRDQKVEPNACVEVKEGDLIRIAASTRIYRLHWIPLNRAYDLDNPFGSPLHASTTHDQDNRIFEAQNLESQADTSSGDDGERHLDVTSQGSGSSVPSSEDEDTYINTRELASGLTLARDSVDAQKLHSDEDFQTLLNWDLDVVETVAETPCKQQCCDYSDGLGSSELEVAAEDDEGYVKEDGGLLLNDMSEMESSVPKEGGDTSPLPLLRDPTETDNLQFTENVQASPDLEINSVEAIAEKPSKEQRPDVHWMGRKSKVKHEQVAPKKIAERSPFQSLPQTSSSQSQPYVDESSERNNISRGIGSSSNLSDGKNKIKWTIVLDTSSLLDKKSRKPLQLLQGLKGTHLVVPRTVLRELNETKLTRNLLFSRRAEIASSALDWIEECKVKTKWWIQLQSPSEETKSTAPTHPVTPQSNVSAFPFSLHWNNYAPEIDSPTLENQVLGCALLYQTRNMDEELVLLSNDVTLKIKAMAEDVICETPHEFYESLKNPFSERFMWPESLPRGRTWSHVDDAVLRERYNNRKKQTLNGGKGESGAAAAKGLKLILLHNSHYDHIH